MLDAKTNRKRFGFQINAALVQHLKGVARAVANGQHHMVAGNVLTARERQAFQFALDDLHVRDFLLEAKFATKLDNARTHLLNHFH